MGEVNKSGIALNRKVLADLAMNEMMITKFQSLVSPQNNNDLKINQNG
jgi:ribosomal protein L20